MRSAPPDATVLRTVVVDDLDAMRFLVRTLLQRDGRFQVVGEAADGAEAVSVARDLRPDLVLLDIDMPKLDGLTTVPAIRAAAPNARIVMLSGYTAADMERRSLDAGATGYVEKRGDLGSLPDQLVSLAAVLDRVTHVLESTYDTGTASARAARRDLRAALAGHVEASALDTLELLSSELVTNAVVHARSAARVRASMVGTRVRISVSDDDIGLPTRSTAGLDDEHGRGLDLVSVLSSSWGITPNPQGKTIWFELEL